MNYYWMMFMGVYLIIRDFLVRLVFKKTLSGFDFTWMLIVALALLPISIWFILVCWPMSWLSEWLEGKLIV